MSGCTVVCSDAYKIRPAADCVNGLPIAKSIGGIGQKRSGMTRVAVYLPSVAVCSIEYI